MVLGITLILFINIHKLPKSQFFQQNTHIMIKISDCHITNSNVLPVS